jgi:hypothetical protein
MRYLTIFSVSVAASSGLGHAAEVDPLTLPLIQKTDIVYVGSFALPNGAQGSSDFSYGGRGLTSYHDETGRATLFMQGKVNNPGYVAQVEVPSSFSKGSDYTALPVAKLLQPFAQVADGSLQSKLGITVNGEGTSVYGLFAHKDRLLVAANEYYGCNQTLTHGVSGLNLGSTTDFAGFYRVTGIAGPRAIAGPMADVPAAWRALVGGSVVSGNFGIPIVSCTSAGPAITAFDPDSLGVSNPVKGSTLLHYATVNYVEYGLCEGAQCSVKPTGMSKSEIYNYTTYLGGMAFPDGSRTVLFIGRQGVGDYCYGTPAECGGDPAEPDAKGPHAFPYRFQVWAYDMVDLMKVKNGTLKSYEPRPYAYWPLNDLEHWVRPGYAKISGAGYDPKTRRWYVATDYGTKPRIDVFEIKEASPNSSIRKVDKRQGSLQLRTRQDQFGHLITIDITGYSAANARPHYRIFDNQGQLVGEVAPKASGSQAIWDASQQSSGVYFVKSEIEGHKLVSKVTLASTPN